ncbi:MAG: AAA family ATPase [Candidatus ainarchaeum sp.]|nr:AAA family ATPase [Candidatus ainarchaeum sp.]
MASFDEILSKPSLFKNINILSPHYVPNILPFRDGQISEIMNLISPALKNQKPRNIFIYGKTGSGKTCTLKHIMHKFNVLNSKASMCYINCRIYNSRYRLMQKLLKQYDPSTDKSGFGLPFFYEKLIEFMNKGNHIIVVLDEIDMIKDLDELIYTLTRINDEVSLGSLTIIGISNRLSFKNELDPRSKSSLYENEIMFPPYSSLQLKHILEQRVSEGFSENAVESSAINLAAAITAQESGDARYALKLLSKAGELAEQSNKTFISDEDVELARKKVEIDLMQEALSGLPEHHQLVLYAIVRLSSSNAPRYSRLAEDNSFDGFFLSGEVYEQYSSLCTQLGKKSKTSRSFREYINDLEMLGFIVSKVSSKGMRGQATLIKLGHESQDLLKILEKIFS